MPPSPNTPNSPNARDITSPDPAPRRAKPVIGLTGGIGSGKSAVAQHFAALGCGIIDADALSREAMADPEVIEALRRRWGAKVVSERGEVDRAALAQIVFEDPAELAQLESVIHPRVHARREAMRAAYQQQPEIRAIVEDCPLLIEKGIDASCDVVVFVDTPRALRVQRVAKTRHWREEDLDQREKRQLPLDTKARRADYIVQNDGTPGETRQRVAEVLSEIIQPPK